MDVVWSKMKNLADGNDNIADWTSKRSVVLSAESTDPTIGNLKFPWCNSCCDIETADSASVMMNDCAMNDEIPDASELVPSMVPEPHCKCIQLNCFVDADHAGNHITW